MGQSYFVSTQTAARQPLFRHERWAHLMLNVLDSYRTSYLLHDYVLMPDHIHLLLTPSDAIEKSMQMVKGGFSYRAKRELGWNGEVWQKGFTDHRIRDWDDWTRYSLYIRMNPVKAGLCALPEEYPYGAAMGSLVMDAVPQRLKPPASRMINGGAEAPPLHAEAPPFPTEAPPLHAEAAPFQAEAPPPRVEATAFQGKGVASVEVSNQIARMRKVAAS